MSGRESKRVYVALLSLALLLIPACAGRETPTLDTGSAPTGEVTEPGEPQDRNGDPAPDAAECGTIAGLACPDGQVCEYEAGKCNVADLGGKCVTRPEICTQMWRPVCGCDGRTYSNDCHRLSAGARKNHDGECEEGAGG